MASEQRTTHPREHELAGGWVARVEALANQAHEQRELQLPPLDDNHILLAPHTLMKHPLEQQRKALKTTTQGQP